MTQFSERVLLERRRKKSARIRPVALVLAPVLAILFQVYVPHVFPLLDFLELPLLVTLHFSLRHRGPLGAVFYGCAVGLAQDSLSGQPLGMYGIVKTLAGYFSASVSQRFEVEHPALTVILTFFFYFFHRFLYWVLSRALLGQIIAFDPQQAALFGLLNAIVAVPFFHILDKLRDAGQ